MCTKLKIPFLLLIALLTTSTAALADPLNQAGGDDVVLDSLGNGMSPADLVMTSGGTLFAAVGWSTHAPDYAGVNIYRSTDGGTQWTIWGEITGLLGEAVVFQKMILAEGVSDRLVVLFSFSPTAVGDLDLMAATADPGAASPSWIYAGVMSETGVSFTDGDICSDAETFSSYYLYAVGEGIDGNGNDIWFSRSTDLGLTWSAAYKIAEQFPDPAFNYIHPVISYGSGNRVHVAWSYGDYCDGGGCVDNALRYRYALNDASGGISDWQPVQNLTTTFNGEDNDPQEILASQTSGHVFLLYNTVGFQLEVKMWYSTDSGSTWPAGQSDFIDAVGGRDIRVRDATLNSAHDKVWVSGRMDGDQSPCDTRAILLESPLTDPLNFNDVVCLSEPSPAQQIFSPGIAAHPSSSTDYALVWSHLAWTCGGEIPWQVQFDATWRDAPGYPNLEPGFPVDLTFVPTSPPAVVDLDAGPELEIVFSDEGGFVQAFDHTGVPFGNWPQYIVYPTPEAPVAVGDLNGSGDMVVVAGTGDGQVWAFDGVGNTLEGFPVDLGTAAPAYVTVGPVAPPYPRSIVACSGNSVFVLNRAGRLVGNTWVLAQPISHQATLGDVTGDDLPEIIVAAGNVLAIIEPANQSPLLQDTVTLYQISDAPVVADLEPDGIREILVSTVNGYLHCLRWDGTDLWSYNSGTSDYLGGAAVGHILGVGDLEIAVTSGGGMRLVLSDGSEHSSYPKYVLSPGNYFIGTPLMDGIHGTSPDIVQASGQGLVWAFWNTGSTTEGWPKPAGDGITQTPATSDIDLDGSNEVVVLTNGSLAVWDVNYPEEPSADGRWPMDAHDPGRTGCADCVPDLVSDVDGSDRVTRLSFAPPNPNPATGPMSFSFALPADAGVQLEVFDVRGHRVRTVKRLYMTRGDHVVQFDGRDDAGRNLASGLYYARLSVRGAGIDRAVARKFTVLR